MDGDRFDGITRRLAQGVSRREALRKIAGGAIGGSLALGGLRRAGAQANKVGVCHQTGSASNPFEYIEVSENAVPAHAAHGDTINPDFSSDELNCGGCGIVCASNEGCCGGVCIDIQSDVTNCGGCGISCDDGIACTTDTCSGGVCANTPVDAACDDGDACTTDTCVVGTGCVSTPLNCDDGIACTTDTCSGGVCANTPVDAACDDGDACTTDTCVVGTGCVNTLKDCSGVANECNDGICIADGSCQAVPTPGEPCVINGEDGTCSSTGTCVPNCVPTNGICTTSADCCAVSEVCEGGVCKLPTTCNLPLQSAQPRIRNSRDVAVLRQWLLRPEYPGEPDGRAGPTPRSTCTSTRRARAVSILTSMPGR